ncbi:ABC transporter [Pseudoalteromonas citrea]|uniref:ABC transporter n=1 Tax=Pseudoalteromonas citrea TaxID=43655 RepID=A0A5S3XRX4_9GAMM|nr:lipocalin-like domain-containing protein [Pseudoalteromonas citrea]TMP38803.1 ABC transporter [Pseudoalteromonas citrea]TMP60131.1 ABC transporter [Pseudoalteromonas citrea]
MVKYFLGLGLLLSILAGCQPAQDKSAIIRQAPPNLGADVVPNTPLVFPRDHGAHLDQSIEWWYVTANLEAEDGSQFGVQWTLFRTSMAEPPQSQSPWWDGQLYFAHFAIQNNNAHHAFEKFARAGQVEITAAPFVARIDDWQLKGSNEDILPMQLIAREGQYAVNLTLDNSVLVRHGIDGYSQKTAQGHASYYYSYPFLDASGTLGFAGKRYQVAGKAWLDREWSSALIDPSQSGWDWFSLQADDPTEGGLMVFCIKNAEQKYDHCSGSRIQPNGMVEKINHTDILLQRTKYVALADKHYPVKWTLDIAGFETIHIHSVNKDARNALSIQYWEGRVVSAGGYTAKGYVELVGY